VHKEYIKFQCKLIDKRFSISNYKLYNIYRGRYLVTVIELSNNDILWKILPMLSRYSSLGSDSVCLPRITVLIAGTVLLPVALLWFLLNDGKIISWKPLMQYDIRDYFRTYRYSYIKVHKTECFIYTWAKRCETNSLNTSTVVSGFLYIARCWAKSALTSSGRRL